MATYDLSAFTILMVEDNDYVRTVLKEVLQDLSVGAIITAENGVEAIDYLNASGAKYDRPIDVVISDLIMSPMDGQLLLRWIRQNKESPNRFMPFIMMSGAADLDRVAEARDNGNTEFLAKPFSAGSVADRILQVIDHPRQFVVTKDFLGPDRHRRKQPVPEDRRRIGPEESTIVYSEETVTRPKRAEDVYLFRLNNALKIKAGGIGAKGAGTIPLQRLREADERLKRKSLEFHDWAQGYLLTVSHLCDRALQQPEDRRRAHFKNINLLAHELRGQGGTFGYPLITIVGKMLYETTHDLCPMDDRAIVIVKAHVDTMYTVFRDKITGEGGLIGRDLVVTLQQSIKRFMMADMRLSDD